MNDDGASVNPGPPEQERTRLARRAVIAAATELFERDGYAATSVTAISRGAGVPAPTVYRLYAGKLAILRGVLDTAIGGDDEQVAVLDRRATREALGRADPRELVAGVVAVTAAIHRRSNAAYHVLVAAAGADPGAADLLRDLTEQRRQGQRGLVRALARAGRLRPGVGEDRAADVVFVLMSPETYRMLVVERGWSARRYRTWLADLLSDQLLEPVAPPDHPAGH